MALLNFHKDHRGLVSIALLVFLFLTLIIAIAPAYEMQETEPLPFQSPLTAEEKSGLKVYVAENCMSCHTQQVRNIEMDRVWGDRPSMPSDYYFSKARMDVWRQSPSLLGSERTGPDLTNVGVRQPGMEWHLLHLYNPRIVVGQSIMPAYPWLFREVRRSSLPDGVSEVPVPDVYKNNPEFAVIPTQQALDLIAYLRSLRQPELPDAADFLPSTGQKNSTASDSIGSDLNGELLYSQMCSSCHQMNGEGLKGAFPPLAGSPVVNDESPDLLLEIILNGYDARPEYGIMPPFAGRLSDAEIAAIANYERSHWGNGASPVSEEDVKKIRNSVIP